MAKRQAALAANGGMVPSASTGDLHAGDDDDDDDA